MGKAYIDMSTVFPNCDLTYSFRTIISYPKPYQDKKNYALVFSAYP